jgi:hypothetical protein
MNEFDFERNQEDQKFVQRLNAGTQVEGGFENTHL